MAAMFVMVAMKNKKGLTSMFSTGLLLSAGATITIAILDKALEDTGFFWLGTVLKLVVPLTGLGVAVYFLEHNPILGWLK